MLHTQADGCSRKAVLSLAGQKDQQSLIGSVRVTGIAAGASTSTTIIPASQVPSTHKIHVISWRITSNDVIWTSGGSDTVTLEDTTGTPIVFLTIAKASLPTTTVGHTPVLGTSTKGLGLTTGGGLGKGLVFKQNATFSGAALLTVEVVYEIRSNTAETFR